MGKSVCVFAFVLLKVFSWSCAQETTNLANITKPGSAAQISTEQGQPTFSCSERVITVGSVPITFPPITNTFTIKNTGTKPLSLRLVAPPCECMLYDLDKTIVLPGEKALLTLALNIADKRGAFWEYIHFWTDDPDNHSVIFGFEGYAYDRVDIEYPDVNFGELNATAIPSFRYPFQVAVHDPSMLALSSIHSQHGYFSGEIKTNSPGLYQVILSFSKLPEEGPFEDILELHFNGEPIPGLPDVGFIDPVTKLPRGSIPKPDTYLMHFNGYVRSAIVPLRRVIPISEFLPYTPAARTFYLQSNTAFHITGIQCDPVFTARTEPLVYQTPSGTWFQKVILQADLSRLPRPASEHSWKIEVRTDDPSAPRIFLYVPDNRRSANKN